MRRQRIIVECPRASFRSRVPREPTSLLCAGKLIKSIEPHKPQLAKQRFANSAWNDHASKAFSVTFNMAKPPATMKNHVDGSGEEIKVIEPPPQLCREYRLGPSPCPLITKVPQTGLPRMPEEAGLPAIRPEGPGDGLGSLTTGAQKLALIEVTPSAFATGVRRMSKTNKRPKRISLRRVHGSRRLPKSLVHVRCLFAVIENENDRQSERKRIAQWGY